MRMNARCTVCDPAKPKVNPSFFAFSQRVAAAGMSRYSASPRKAQRNRTNEIRAVVRIATRIVISSIMSATLLPQNIRSQLTAVNQCEEVNLQEGLDSGTDSGVYALPRR